MSTPHIEAEKGQIAKTVLMPGDPLRAKFVAENFLENPKLVNRVRNIFAYTGTYKGKEVTVMASGMGMPSIGIYSYELYHFYDVENIIRIGSAGGYDEKLHVFDTVLADSAYSDSTYAFMQGGSEEHVQYPSAKLNETIKEAAKDLGIPLTVGRIHSGDVFYYEPTQPPYTHFRDDCGCIAVEMESFALFHNAKMAGKNAACLITISDTFASHEDTTPEEREKSFGDMMKIALEAAIRA